MNEWLFDGHRLDAWVVELIRTRRVIGVQAKGDAFVFAPLERASDLRLDYDVTILPPKKLFQPQIEDLMKFGPGTGYESILDNEPFVLLGVHPYDMEAINQMDMIFSKDHCDVHYIKRRKQATLVVCDIQTASSNIFAGCMGTATVDQGFDVLLTRVGDRYVVEARTEEGRKLFSNSAQIPAADSASLARREQVWEDNRRLLRKHDLKVPLSDLPTLLERSYDHPVWADRSKRCFSCGSCNLVCPTCYCFDVCDHINWDLQNGTRRRTWDGCLLKDFASVAGGHNFRKQRNERYRHRYYRKGKYIPDMIGKISCVGCGRCISACVTKIANPVEVYNRLLEVE